MGLAIIVFAVLVTAVVKYFFTISSIINDQDEYRIERAILQEAQTEESIATKLRDCCTEDGRERKDQLRKTAGCFYELGIVYFKQAKMSINMEEKMNFIRCIALFMASQVRYNILQTENPSDCFQEQEQKVREKIDAYQKLLVRKCENRCNRKFNTIETVLKNLKKRYNGKVNAIGSILGSLEKKYKAKLNIVGSDLLDISKFFFDELGKRRSIFKRDQLPKIRKNNDSEAVRKLTENVSENFRIIIEAIAAWVFGLLGKPKCEFAIIGLGSLARKEATYYSDLEYVIVLEKDFQLMSRYEKENILEYFRWFAVILQSIIIGYGETVVKSVGVENLNDLTADEKDVKKNWFYDHITPSGVALDGMVPHACITPLGRNRETPKGRKMFELIDTATNMAKYLSTDSLETYGYHLKDILKTSCLIIGSDTVYSNFKNESKLALTGSDLTKEMKHMKENLEYLCPKQMFGKLENINAKSDFYRPFQLLISMLDVKHEIDACSSFEIIDKLLTKDVIEKNIAKKLGNAMAVICQIRMEAYSKFDQDRCVLSIEEIRQIVGMDRLTECLAVIFALYDEIMKNLGEYKISFDTLGFLEQYNVHIRRIEQSISKVQEYLPSRKGSVLREERIYRRGN